jgi:hypothetical protein
MDTEYDNIRILRQNITVKKVNLALQQAVDAHRIVTR